MARGQAQPPAATSRGMRELFRGAVRRMTLLTIAVCACSLTAWWAFMFWHPQHLRNLPEVAAWPAAAAQEAGQPRRSSW